METFEKSKKSPTDSEAPQNTVFSPQEITKIAQLHEPADIYDLDGNHLLPIVEEAVMQIMPVYDGIADIGFMLMLNDPEEMKANIHKADVDTLLIFFKFLAVKAGETGDTRAIGVIQNYLISVLQAKLR